MTPTPASILARERPRTNEIMGSCTRTMTAVLAANTSPIRLSSRPTNWVMNSATPESMLPYPKVSMSRAAAA